ncbi:MAG: aspartate aminotransferase family protein [Oscillospiraceae bacterium]|nr:aspartate aminotransferase family protein [Oscillospiraceae bacterium]
MTDNISSPDPRLARTIAADQAAYLPVFGQRIPLVFDHGQGCRLTATDGQDYLDMVGGIAVNVLGYANPRLTDTIAKQAARLIHSSNLYYVEQQAKLAVRLTQLCGQDRAFFCNSGAEANEAAFKLARIYYYRQGKPRARILSARQSFHGRTLATVTATGQPKYNLPYAPLPPGFDYVAFNDLASLKQQLTPDTAAVILELVQGESGVHPVDPAYAKAARDLCTRNGTLLIIDEVQSGMGRTGHFLAAQAYGIKPDIVTLAKGLGGGLPIGALLCQEQLATAFHPGDHGSTFGGGPLCCSAALTVLDEYERLDLTHQAGQRGRQLTAGLRQLQKEHPLLKEIRSAGLMLGADLQEPQALALREDLRTQEHVLVNATGPATLRLLPPLILTEAEARSFLTAMDRALSRLEAQA